MVLGFLTPKNKEIADPDLEYVWLGDVETGHYASVLGSPNYQEAVRAYASGEKIKDPPTQDPDQFLNEFTPNGRAIASLIKTGFLSAQDYVVLDNSAETLREVKAAGGEQGLDTLLTLATPRREKFKRQLLEKYDTDNNVPHNKRFKVARLHDFQPGVQTYIWALDEAARKRQRTRMRRRATAGRRQQELRYDAYLRRGGAPFRGPRTDAETLQELEGDTPVSGKAYIEENHICMYWYNPTLKRWTRMLGVDTSFDNKRKALLANRGRTQDIEDTFDFQSGKRKQQSYGTAKVEGKVNMFKCMDKQGVRSLNLHQQWFEHKYALPTNRGECEGLCSFNDGWIFPEGEDGLPNDLDLAFDEQGEPLATHVTCAACNTRLCRKCYFTMLKYHGPNLAGFVDIYYRYRSSREYSAGFMTYVSFLNDLLSKDPKALEYKEEDPVLSADYRDNDRLAYEAREGIRRQQELQKRLQQQSTLTPQQKATQEQAVQEKAAQEKAVQEKAAQEKAAQEKAAQEKAAQEKAAQEKAAQVKAAQEKAAREKAAQEQAAQERSRRSRAYLSSLTPPTSPEPDSTSGGQNKPERQGLRNSTLSNTTSTTTQSNAPRGRGTQHQSTTRTISLNNSELAQSLLTRGRSNNANTRGNTRANTRPQVRRRG